MFADAGSETVKNVKQTSGATKTSATFESLGNRVGIRISFTASIPVWSLATIGPLVKSVFGCTNGNGCHYQGVMREI